MTAAGLRALENRFYALIRHREAGSVARAPAGGAGLEALRSHDYCVVVTYRRDGTPVATPVWFTLDGDRLLFESDRDSGKVRRLRRDPSVRVAPANSRGRPLGPPVDGQARVLPAEEGEAIEALLLEKYGRTRRIAQRMRPASPGPAYVEVRARG